MMFKCDMCGECCRNLDKSVIYRDLHDGNGVCRFLDGNICTIYDKRPLICRIDDSFEAFFKEQMSYEEYLRHNYECCKILKMQKRSKEEV